MPKEALTQEARDGSLDRLGGYFSENDHSGLGVILATTRHIGLQVLLQSYRVYEKKLVA